eukprot:6177171-Pleurochrysis_carterae.AAC.1
MSGDTCASVLTASRLRQAKFKSQNSNRRLREASSRAAVEMQEQEQVLCRKLTNPFGLQADGMTVLQIHLLKREKK